MHGHVSRRLRGSRLIYYSDSQSSLDRSQYSGIKRKRTENQVSTLNAASQSDLIDPGWFALA
jgi:hypothetical protein